MTRGVRVVDNLTGHVLLVERNGDNLKVTAPKGVVTKEVLERLADIKDLLLPVIDAAEQGGWCEELIPEDTHWVSPAEVKARSIDKVFNTLGNASGRAAPVLRLWNTGRGQNAESAAGL